MGPLTKTFHKANSRGHADHGWLKSHHTFSFADYYNPERMGFGVLRVINDDWVAPGQGFGTHPHKNMEIVSIPLNGSLSHRDSEGNGEVIKKGEVQVMSAGTGIRHSEFNPSETDGVNFLQIWVMPKLLNIPPRYEQKFFAAEDRHNQFQTVISADKDSDALWINQDAYFSLADLDSNRSLTYERKHKDNGLYLFVISGEVLVENETLSERDAVGFAGVANLKIDAKQDSEILLIEVPMHIPTLN